MSDSEVLAGLLGEAARRHVGARGIEGLARLSAGATQEIWRFDLAAADGSRTPAILRRAPGGSRVSDTAVGLETEARMMATAGRRDEALINSAPPRGGT